MLLNLALVLVIVAPVAWLWSEFLNNRPLRIALGIFAIAMISGVAAIVGSLDRLRSNIYFAEATKDLIQYTIVALEAGHEDEVLNSLIALRTDFRPTYETRDEFDVFVEDYVNRLPGPSIHHEAGDPYWSH